MGRHGIPELKEHIDTTIVNAFAIPPRYLMPFDAVRVIEDRKLVDMVEDWSRVRSPSRAERRRRLGHRQNITMVAVPNKTVYSLDHGRTLIMHPDSGRAAAPHPDAGNSLWARDRHALPRHQQPGRDRHMDGRPSNARRAAPAKPKSMVPEICQLLRISEFRNTSGRIPTQDATIFAHDFCQSGRGRSAARFCRNHLRVLVGNLFAHWSRQ